MNAKRSIPSVSRLIEEKEIKLLIQRYSRESTINAIRTALGTIRKRGKGKDLDAIIQSVKSMLAEYSRIGFKRVINATGTLVHTNLGRSVLSQDILSTICNRLKGYSDLEFDIKTGKRGKRALHAEEKINHLAGSEAALVVNNNAAAVMLAINTFSFNREVIVSRGELVEIGGSFRLPEIIERAGGILKEVGTTNRTRLSDYKRAISRNTGIILKMHMSNYRIEGFTEEVGIKELAILGRKHRLPVVHDVGSGLFVPAADWDLGNEPEPGESIRLGASIVTMSGDKLIGGPQAGLAAGKKRYIQAMNRNPMMRALRPGKISLVALEAALIPFINPKRIREVVLFDQLGTDLKQRKAKAGRLAKKIQQANPSIKTAVEPAEGSVGGGTQPGRTIPSFAILVSHPKTSPQKLAALFRTHPVPIIGTFHKGIYCLNICTVLKGEEKEIIEASRNII
jgi:L-seryl-tRNA(Ser) seleniumtransferase